MGMLLVAYPFVVYMGLQYIEPKWLSTVLAAIVCIRLLLSRGLLEKLPWLVPASILGLGTLTVSLFSNHDIGIKFYPVAVNLAMLVVFAYSLFNKPCVIETFARIQEPDLPQKGVEYTEKVTLVWCVFFIVNGAISSYTALAMSQEAWTLYNGFISYLAMGCLFIVEWCVRQVKKKENE